MTAILWSRNTLIWVVLVGATALSWSVGHGLGISNARVGGVVILLTAFVKVRFVIVEFMEIRGAPIWMRRAADGGVLVVAGLLGARLVIGS